MFLFPFFAFSFSLFTNAFHSCFLLLFQGLSPLNDYPFVFFSGGSTIDDQTPPTSPNVNPTTTSECRSSRPSSPSDQQRSSPPSPHQANILSSPHPAFLDQTYLSARSKSPFRESENMVIDEDVDDDESDYDNEKDKKGQNPSMSPGNSLSSKRKKKTRTVFSRSQVFQLESTFDMKRYLSSSERAGLAASLHLTETQVNYLLSSSFALQGVGKILLPSF